MTNFHSFINEYESEQLISAGRHKEALDLLLKAYSNKEYINSESILESISYCYLQLKEYDKALIYIQKLIENNPHHTDAHFNQAYCFFQLKKYRQSVELYRRLLDEEKQGTSLPYSLARFQLGMGYLYLNQPEMSHFYFQQLIGSDLSSETIYNFGVQIISAGFAAEARDFFLKYLNYKPKDIDAVFGLGITYLENREFRKAIECFTRVIRWNKSRYPNAYIMLGMSYFQIGQLEEAIVNVKEALRYKDSHIDALYYLAVIYDSVGQEHKAIKYLQKAGELDRQSPDIWEKLGNIYLNQKQFNKARINLKKAYYLSRKPELAYKIGLIFMVEERYNEAIDYLTLSLEQQQNIYDIYENLGICYYHLKKYYEAVQYLEPIFKKGIERDIIYFVYGNSLMKLGRLEEAKEALEKAYKLNSSDINILYSLGLLEANCQDFKEASRYLEKALTIKRDPDIIYALALTKMKLGESKTAVNLFEEYRRIKKIDPNMLYKLGLLYIQLRDFEKAQHMFEEIPTEAPEYHQAQEYLNELKKL